MACRWFSWPGMRGHRLPPSEVPYRANIHAMKQLGVRYLLSVSARVLKEDSPVSTWCCPTSSST
jgi:purine nucleoside phosphorylase